MFKNVNKKQCECSNFPDTRRVLIESYDNITDSILDGIREKEERDYNDSTDDVFAYEEEVKFILPVIFLFNARALITLMFKFSLS